MLTQSEGHPPLQQQWLVSPQLIYSKLQIGTRSQSSYYRPADDPSYGRAVLSGHSATNNTVDMGDWAFWNIIHKWLRPRSGCQLFRIVWRRWSRTYQRSHPSSPVGTQVQLLKGRGGTLIVGFCSYYPEDIQTAKSCSNRKTGHTPLICLTSSSSYNS